MKNFDICIIGAGPGGYKAALILAKNGKSICLIEKGENHIGGTCLNEGCIPAKNFLESSSYIRKFSYFKRHGLKGSVEGFDLDSLKSETSKLLNTLRDGLSMKLQKSGVEIVFDEAKFVSKDSVLLKNSNQTVKAKKFIIATGSIHKEHPVLKTDSKKIIFSDDMFCLDSIPKDTLIIGAGAIGCEFADFLNALGSNIHLCEFTPSILPLEDKDASLALQREFKKRGIKVDISVNALSYELKEDKVIVEFEKNNKRFTQAYDKVLIAIGRKPNTKNLSLDRAEVETDERGFIKTDFTMKSTNENIYAVGDVTKSASLAHVAYYEAKQAAFDILGFEPLKESAVPSVIFTSPQVASVGKSEKQLQDNGIEYSVKKLFLRTLGMPKIKGDDSGFVKLLFDKDKKLLGASMVGYDMTEIINQAMICVNARLSAKELISMIFAHPTMSESFYKTIES